MPDPKAVNAMFARVAPRYDLANRVLSGGMDVYWRRRLVAAVRRQGPGEILDLATGSGDVAFALARGLPAATRITGMDFCQPMLDQAEARRAASQDPNQQKIAFQQGDGLSLPVADASFDAVTIAFGLRNMADRAKALAEMRRVLRPGGQVYVLEFSQPAAWFRPLYYIYLKRIAPLLAGLLTGERSAYGYLASSIAEFPDRGGLTREIQAASFSKVTATSATFCIVALHQATA